MKQVNKQHDFSSIHIQFPTGRTDAIQTGASVAINGTCLTVSLHRQCVLVLLLWRICTLLAAPAPEASPQLYSACRIVLRLPFCAHESDCRSPARIVTPSPLTSSKRLCVPPIWVSFTKAVKSTSKGVKPAKSVVSDCTQPDSLSCMCVTSGLIWSSSWQVSTDGG